MRQLSATHRLAVWFVTEFIGRPMTDTDWKGMHVKHAKVLLHDYEEDEIKGCLVAMQRGFLSEEPAQAQNMMWVRYGEPPWIERYLLWKQSPPLVWDEWATSEWETLTGSKPEVEFHPSQTLPQLDAPHVPLAN